MGVGRDARPRSSVAGVLQPDFATAGTSCLPAPVAPLPPSLTRLTPLAVHTASSSFPWSVFLLWLPFHHLLWILPFCLWEAEWHPSQEPAGRRPVLHPSSAACLLAGHLSDLPNPSRPAGFCTCEMGFHWEDPLKRWARLLFWRRRPAPRLWPLTLLSVPLVLSLTGGDCHSCCWFSLWRKAEAAFLFPFQKTNHPKWFPSALALFQPALAFPFPCPDFAQAFFSLLLGGF